jgi:hypothetical protein
MAERALGAGTTRRRRVLFGLLDADGWSWATLKALFWFLVIIFLMGYLPDRAYYFTVFSTIDLGIRSDALTPINFCPAENRNLPCPAPAGAILPWDHSPQELLLPAGRRDGAAVQVGTHLLYIGGTDGKAAAKTVFEADLPGNGNFSAWRDGPGLPAARTKPAAGFFGGSVYAVGGSDDSGKPTDTVYILTPDAKTGELGTWQPADGSVKDVPNLKLPAPRSGAMLVPAADGLILIGGSDGSKPTNTVWKSTADAKTGALGAWQAETPMVDGSNNPQPRADAAAILSGNWVFVYGGTDAAGPTASVLRGDLGTGGDAGKVVRWGSPINGSANLPAPRTGAASWTANGAIYLAGGSDGTTPASDVWFTTPDGNGAINGWSHLSQGDLPAGGLVGGSAVVSGSNAFIIGGQSANGITNASVRTSLAPKPPFFQVGGPLGMTVPALKIDGEIGQQIGYLNAAGVATVNFVLLLLIGWAYAHKAETRALWNRVRRRGHG